MMKKRESSGRSKKKLNREKEQEAEDDATLLQARQGNNVARGESR